MSIKARFLVVRHAVPEKEQNDDPGIDVTRHKRDIDGTAWTLSTILEDAHSSRLAVFSSPKRRAMQTAEAIAASSHLESFVIGQVLAEPRLDEEGFAGTSPDQLPAEWATTLSSISAMALSSSDESGMPTILLVTHEPVIKRMPQLHRPNTENLGVNEFTITIE